MKIYILDQDPKKTAEYLDDKSLSNAIKDIAQVLFNVHHDLIEDRLFESSKYSTHCKKTIDRWKSEVPSKSILVSKDGLLNWSQWAKECKSNYFYLVEFAICLCDEHAYRFYINNEIHPIIKYEKIIEWARENVPDLPENYEMKLEKYKSPKYPSVMINLPLIIPKKYIIECDSSEDRNYMVTESYINYYQAKLHKSMLEYLRDNKQKPTWTKRGKPDWIKL